MIHIFICEDEISHQKMIANTIENYNLFHNNCLMVQGIFSSSEELQKNFASIHLTPETTVFLLDVELQGETTGIELGKKIYRKFPDSYIIFITSHRDLCYLTFELQVKTFDYIIKDDATFMERFTSCINRLLLTIETKPTMSAKYFAYRIGAMTNRIPEEQIYYFTVSKNSHKVILYTKYKNVEFYDSLKNIHASVSEDFIFCHNSYLINTCHISQYDHKSRNVLLDNGYTCPVSIRHQKNIQSFIL